MRYFIRNLFIFQLHKELTYKTTTTLEIIKASQEKINQTKELNIYTSLSSDLDHQAQTSHNYFNKGDKFVLIVVSYICIGFTG